MGMEVKYYCFFIRFLYVLVNNVVPVKLAAVMEQDIPTAVEA